MSDTGGYAHDVRPTFKAKRPRRLNSPERRATAPVASEFQDHVAVAGELRWRATPGVVWLHYPAGELRDKRAASKLKSWAARLACRIS